MALFQEAANSVGLQCGLWSPPLISAWDLTEQMLRCIRSCDVCWPVGSLSSYADNGHKKHLTSLSWLTTSLDWTLGM
eukprot:2242061-Amphidinium_carterae.2